MKKYFALLFVLLPLLATANTTTISQIDLFETSPKSIFEIGEGEYIKLDGFNASYEKFEADGSHSIVSKVGFHGSFIGFDPVTQKVWFSEYSTHNLRYLQVDQTSGQLVVSNESYNTDFDGSLLSINNDRVFFQERYNDGKLQVMDITTNEIIEVFEVAQVNFLSLAPDGKKVAFRNEESTIGLYLLDSGNLVYPEVAHLLAYEYLWLDDTHFFMLTRLQAHLFEIHEDGSTDVVWSYPITGAPEDNALADKMYSLEYDDKLKLISIYSDYHDITGTHYIIVKTDNEFELLQLDDGGISLTQWYYTADGNIRDAYSYFSISNTTLVRNAEQIAKNASPIAVSFVKSDSGQLYYLDNQSGIRLMKVTTTTEQQYLLEDYLAFESIFPIGETYMYGNKLYSFSYDGLLFELSLETGLTKQISISYERSFLYQAKVQFAGELLLLQAVNHAILCDLAELVCNEVQFDAGHVNGSAVYDQKLIIHVRTELQTDKLYMYDASEKDWIELLPRSEEFETFYELVTNGHSMVNGSSIVNEDQLKIEGNSYWFEDRAVVSSRSTIPKTLYSENNEFICDAYMNICHTYNEFGVVEFQRNESNYDDLLEQILDTNFAIIRDYANSSVEIVRFEWPILPRLKKEYPNHLELSITQNQQFSFNLSDYFDGIEQYAVSSDSNFYFDSFINRLDHELNLGYHSALFELDSMGMISDIVITNEHTKYGKNGIIAPYVATGSDYHFSIWGRVIKLNDVNEAPRTIDEGPLHYTFKKNKKFIIHLKELFEDPEMFDVNIYWDNGEVPSGTLYDNLAIGGTPNAYGSYTMTFVVEEEGNLQDEANLFSKITIKIDIVDENGEIPTSSGGTIPLYSLLLVLLFSLRRLKQSKV